MGRPDDLDRVLRPRAHRPADVVALGDVTVDVIAHFAEFPTEGRDMFCPSIQFHCGGSAANTALALVQLGWVVSLIARVGRDPAAETVVSSMRRVGVRLSGLQRDPEVATGLIYIIVTPGGERTMLSYRGANARLQPAPISESQFRRARLFLLSGYALLTDPQRSAARWALGLAQRHGLAVALDPGSITAPATLSEMRSLLSEVGILLPTLAEAQGLSGRSRPEECADALLAQGVGAVAIKLGNSGCLVSSHEGSWRLPAFPIQAQDTTGAGDSFNAGLIAGYLGRLDWPACAVLGNALGGLTAGRVGAGEQAPQAGQALSLLAAHLDDPAYAEHRPAIEQAIGLLSQTEDRQW